MKLAALAALVVVGACGGTPARVASMPSSPPPPAVDSRPLAATVTVNGSASIFQGGDDHIVVYVVNRGRRIERFALSAGPWLAEHSFAMGSTRLCDQDPSAQYVVCGPIAAGDSAGYTLRTIPSYVGDFEFTFEPFDLVDGQMLPIPDPSGAPQVLRLHEQVVPVTNQIPGYHPESPTPSG
jgi:hypothetical protein